MEVPSTEMRKTRAGTGLGALLRPSKSRWPFSIQVEMLKGKVDISHFIFKAACGIDCVINEETSISALKFCLKWHIFSVDILCKWWSQDLNPTKLTAEPMLSLLYSASWNLCGQVESTHPSRQALWGVECLCHPELLYDFYRECLI